MRLYARTVVLSVLGVSATPLEVRAWPLTCPEGRAPADARAPDPQWTTAARHLEPQLRSPLALVASPAQTPLCVTTDAVFIAPGAAPPVPAGEPFPTSASFVFLAWAAGVYAAHAEGRPPEALRERSVEHAGCFVGSVGVRGDDLQAQATALWQQLTPALRGDELEFRRAFARGGVSCLR
ncbi:MAG: hypothetical protein ACOYM9_25345 [Bradymonadia bacterium]